MQYDRISINMHKPYAKELINYKDYMLYERQVTSGTALAYVFYISKFGDFLNKELKMVWKEDIRNFIKHLKDKGRKNTTVIMYMASLRSYYNYLAGTSKDDELQAICFFLNRTIRIKKEKTVPQVPRIEEIEKVRQTMQSDKAALYYRRHMGTYKRLVRDMAIFEMLIATGARNAEIRGMRVCDLDVTNTSVFIKRGKGGHQRVALFSHTAQMIVSEHIEINAIKDNDLIFPIKQGNLLGYIIKRWAKKSGINPRIYPHSLRHYHITESQRNGVDIQSVADQVGHVSLNTTRHYTHLDLPHRREQYKNREL